jgi:hypothetical protein
LVVDSRMRFFPVYAVSSRMAKPGRSCMPLNNRWTRSRAMERWAAAWSNGDDQSARYLERLGGLDLVAGVAP